MTVAELRKRILALDGKKARNREDYEIRPNWICKWLFHRWTYYQWPPEASFPRLFRKCERCNERSMDTFPWGFK